MSTIDTAINVLTDSIEKMETQLELMKKQLYVLKTVSGFTEDTDLYMSTREVCDLLNISTNTLARYKNGKVPSRKPPFPKPVMRSDRGKMYERGAVFLWKEACID